MCHCTCIRKANEYSKNIVDMILQNIKDYKLTKSLTNCNIIISHILNGPERYNDNAINIIISGESRDPKHTYDISIGTPAKFNSGTHIYFPYLYASLYEHKKSTNYSDYTNTRKFFCAFMYSASHKHRIELFKLVNNYKNVYAIGSCCHNHDIGANRFKNDKDCTWLDEAVNIYTDYKFVLAIENKNIKGYFTEKIINPLIAGSLPIYWGTSDIFEYVNKERVIYAPDYTDEELVDIIKKIDNNDNLSNEIVSKDIFLKDKTPNDMEQKLKSQLTELFSDS